jgi:hypothetical protein
MSWNQLNLYDSSFLDQQYETKVREGLQLREDPLPRGHTCRKDGDDHQKIKIFGWSYALLVGRGVERLNMDLTLEKTGMLPL